MYSTVSQTRSIKSFLQHYQIDRALFTQALVLVRVLLVQNNPGQHVNSQAPVLVRILIAESPVPLFHHLRWQRWVMHHPGLA